MTPSTKQWGTKVREGQCSQREPSRHISLPGSCRVTGRTAPAAQEQPGMASEQQAAASGDRVQQALPAQTPWTALPAHPELRWVQGSVLLIFNFFNYCYIFYKRRKI